MIKSQTSPINPIESNQKSSKDERKRLRTNLKETVNNLYWLSHLKLPGLWYGAAFQEDSNMANVSVIGYNEIGKESSNLKMERNKLVPLEYWHLHECEDSRISGKVEIS
jgi:hypothetical protein